MASFGFHLLPDHHLIRPGVLRRLAQTWNKFPSHSEPGDKTLMDVLHTNSKSDLNSDLEYRMQLLLFDYIPSFPDCPSKIKDLLSIINSDKSALLFSKETIQGFHELVVSAFTGFARAFLLIKNKYSKLVCMDYQALEM